MTEKKTKKDEKSKIWTQGQTRFLTQKRPEFEKAQLDKSTRTFWPIVNAEFFQKYPMPQSELDELNAEEAEGEAHMVEHTSSTSKPKKREKAEKKAWPTFSSPEDWRKMREKQIHQWFYNVTNDSRASQAKVQVVVAQASSQGRVLSEEHIYARMYYNDRVKPKVDAEKLLNPDAAPIAIMNRVLRELYKNEDDETKQAVRKERDNLLEQKKKDTETIAKALDEPDDQHAYPPEEIAQFLGVLKDVMNTFFGPVERKTGWVWTVMGAGPDPRKPNGQITTKSFHYGETPTHKTFFDWHPMFNREFMNPLSSFAHQVFPEAIRKEQALDQQKLKTWKSSVNVSRDAEDTDEVLAPSVGTSTPSYTPHRPLNASLDLHDPAAPSQALSQTPGGAIVASTSNADPEPVKNPTLELFKALSSSKDIGSAFDEMRGLLEEPSGSLSDIGLYSFNRSGHPASLEPELGSFENSLMQGGWIDYGDATKDNYIPPGTSLPPNNPTFDTPLFPATTPSNPSTDLYLPVSMPFLSPGPIQPMSMHSTAPLDILDPSAQSRLPNAQVSGANQLPVPAAASTALDSSTVLSKRRKRGGEDDDVAADEHREAKRRTRKPNRCREMPDWMRGAKRYLEVDLDDPVWTECLSKWWLWEERSAMLASAQSCLPGNASRPEAVTKWLQKKVFVAPLIPDLEQFADEWEEWLQKAMESGVAGMKKPGQTGIVILLISLKWWRGAKGREDRWTKAVVNLSSWFAEWV
ncbi:hypothetical protein BKA70DRAFT_1441935 [Coprinopsis sp. MPI-PUGE-AT-0042]|nr:hypothetical protein BKA70DRAFT_1441935 [Coprinopsis sp. MPI-PUGE-AT-0042]